MKKVLTIAGSDSGGGAGIQADLKTFSARGVFGMSAITALTAQNTVGVQGVYEIDASFVEKQIDSVMTDIKADAWKTGMLANAQIVEIVAKCARKYNIHNLIVDPVMLARSGDPLLKLDAVEIYKTDLFPLTLILTPNREEAEYLSKQPIKSIEDTERVAKILYEMGPKNILIKGGHIETVNEAIDVLYDGKQFTYFHAERINTHNTHGTGCTYASAIAAEVAKGQNIKEAIHIAKSYITAAIIYADKLQIGKGYGPTNHFQGTVVPVNLNLVTSK
ncbi:MAG: bifunctional hydroxymethylpyrimidine kinase/phosphomethylpyrimidine kinase [Candidatus Lokiarchaeota archaeon]|nr:bifunctional hydroxymethylpyrimidine kinase/phosphomethylpyrimidine kinase [Candidatus Lokiarchaeota archaeon]